LKSQLFLHRLALETPQRPAAANLCRGYSCHPRFRELFVTLAFHGACWTESV